MQIAGYSGGDGSDLRAVAPWKPRRRALVTGGLRGLGVRVVEWLLASGRADSVVAAGRHAPSGEQAGDSPKLLEPAPFLFVCPGRLLASAVIRGSVFVPF